MTADYPVDEVPATPEYVLEVLREWTIFPVRDQPYPTEETPLPEWLGYLLHEMSTELLRQAINVKWSADISTDEWRRFEPEWSTVGELCRLIAIRGRRPTFRPWHSPVGECLPSGVFLTVRSLLAAAGADPNGIMPSAPLASYHDSLVGLGFTLAEIAPGRQLRFLWDHPAWVERTTCAGCILYPVSTLVAAILHACGRREAALAVAFAAMARLMGTFVLMRLTRIPRIEPDHILTFRDLAYCLAGEEPRRPRPVVA